MTELNHENDETHKLYNTEATQYANLLYFEPKLVLNAFADDHLRVGGHQLGSVLDGGTLQVAILAENRTPEEEQQVCARGDHEIWLLNEHVCHFTGDPLCAVSDAEKQASAFATICGRDRRTWVRSIMYVLATKLGVCNELKTHISAIRERASLAGSEPKYPSAFCRKMGKRVCRSDLCGIVKVHPCTVARYAERIANAHKLELLNPENRGNRKRQLFQHSTICVDVSCALLRNERNAVSYGQIVDGQNYGSLSAVEYYNQEVYTVYTTQWHSISQSKAGRVKQPRTQPLNTNFFVRVWREHFPTLRIFRAGCDFFNT